MSELSVADETTREHRQSADEAHREWKSVFTQQKLLQLYNQGACKKHIIMSLASHVGKQIYVQFLVLFTVMQLWNVSEYRLTFHERHR